MCCFLPVLLGLLQPISIPAAFSMSWLGLKHKESREQDFSRSLGSTEGRRRWQSKGGTVRLEEKPFLGREEVLIKLNLRFLPLNPEQV